MCSLLALETEFIDWRRFLLAAAQPWPPASKIDLLMTLERCRELDTTMAGSITQNEFDGVRCFRHIYIAKYVFSSTDLV